MLDLAGDILAEGWSGHLAVEGAALLALLAGMVSGAVHVRSLMQAARRDEVAVAAARGAIAELIERRFETWGLTQAETEVALFALKGCDAGEIGRLRGAAPGTARAQLARIYAKAGVSSHSGLVALFLDDLIDPDGLRAYPQPGIKETK